MSDQQNTHLHHIKIDGFKSIKHLDLEMNPINILIGANGAGKSNFISLFAFLQNLSQGKLRTYVEINGGANTFFHFGPKTTSKMTIDIKIGNNGYHVDFAYGESDIPLVFDYEYCTIYSSGNRYQIKGKPGESGLLRGSEAKSVPVREYTRQYMQECGVYHFHDTSATADFKQPCELYSNVFLYPNAKNIAPFLYYLRENWEANYQDIVSAVQTVAPFFHDFYLEPQGQKGIEYILLRWIHRDYNEPFFANQLSDGTARFVCMATLFLQPEKSRPKTIILDEPELGMHPVALVVLSDIIKSVSKTNQLICATQSVTFANQFKPEDFIVVDQEKGASKFKRPDKNGLEQWLCDYGMGDIWDKNLIGGRPDW